VQNIAPTSLSRDRRIKMEQTKHFSDRGLFSFGRPHFLLQKNIEFFKIYSGPHGEGEERGIGTVLTFFWTREGHFFMIL